MFTRHQLISILLKEYGLDESMRSFLASQDDTTLLSNTGFTCIRKGYYF